MSRIQVVLPPCDPDQSEKRIDLLESDICLKKVKSLSQTRSPAQSFLEPIVF